MKFTAVVALLAAAAVAVPTGLERRQFGGMTENELKSGSCKKITLVYARGSTEMGNMVCMLLSNMLCFLELTFTRARPLVPPLAVASRRNSQAK